MFGERGKCDKRTISAEVTRRNNANIELQSMT